ncbi:MAG: hypothetical protein R3C19_03220 [Planctomycetaceae bacterium]
MIRHIASAFLIAAALTGTASAHDPLWFAGGPPAYAFGGQTVTYQSVSIAPAAYPAPVVVQQPAYVVPTAVSVYSYPVVTAYRGPLAPAPVSVVTYNQVFAPTVPVAAAYYGPVYRRPHFHRVRPHGVAIGIGVY